MASSRSETCPREPVGAFVLAGGESSRMGRDKALLEIDGVPMIVRTTRLVEGITARATIVGQAESYQRLGLRAIRDDWPHAGPLGAIATALRFSDCAWNLILACDLPYLTREWLEFLVGRARECDADALLPMNDGGAEPLCAMYAKSCGAAVWMALDRGVRKVTDGLAHLRVEHLEPTEWKIFDSDGLLFKNINSPKDYEEVAKRAEGARRNPSEPERTRRKA